MHHGSGSQNMQRQLQRSKSVSGSEAEEQQQQAAMAVTQQQATVNHPQSPVTTFSCSASSSAPQSPNYQIIMSRSPSMNITLTTLPIQNPASPGFQHTTTQWRFEPYIQVTSPLPQPIQPQSPTQHSPVPLQSVTRPGAPATPLSVCGQSPGFVDANMMRIGGQPGLAQIATTTPNQVQLASPGTPGAVRERRPSQTGGTIHHLGPQSPVATGATLSTLSSPGHISTSNLPPQISSIIQGQLGRPVMFEKTAQAVVGPTSSASFSIPSSIPPSSPSLTSSTQGIPGNPLVPTSISVGTMKKPVPKKLEEIAPSTPEIAQLRKQCLEHHTKKMESLKEVFKEYLIELFFLQHLQGNMMDYLAFKKKPCVPLYTYLRQNDLDLEDEEEEEDLFLLSFFVLLSVPLLSVSYNLITVYTGGMPPTPQAAQIAGQKQNQQQYDPSKGPPVQNAASLHTPPPQLPGRLPQGVPPMASLPMTLSQQAQLVENTAQHSGQLQAQVKVQAGGPVLATVNPHTQLQAQLQQQMQPGIHLQLQPQQQQSQAILQSGQAVKQLQHGPGLLPEIKILVSQPLSIFQESQVHQRISELRKEGQWSASRLPKLMEASRPKSHWDYLLEEMQWMAADFAQERRWKEAAAKKLVRTCARYHQEQKKQEERSKKEREFHLRHIASTIAREVEFFWSNIEQVVEIKLQFEIYEKRLKALSLQKTPSKVPGQPTEEKANKEVETECPASSPPEAVLIDSLLSVDQYRGADKATSSDSDGKPARDIAEVAAATELILPKGSFRTTSSVTPFLLHGSLREYQQIGVDWLANLYKKHLNGILADETGLGKTIQTVAYMAHLAGQEGIWGPHLIVVRTCKLLSWEVEFKRWCPGLKILLYLGNRRQRRSKRMWWGEANNFHVCLTSYKLLMKDQIHFLKRRWRHLILDEVQLIKNMTEKHWETIFALTSEQRILLINTPLQNTLKELWTMIHFLLPGITRPYSDFPVKAGTDQNQDYCHKLVIRLHRMIQPFILRRSKRDVEKQLPKKYEHILKCRLSSRQKSLYEDILTQSGSQEALKTGHFVSVLQVLMQLQRVCNHPELVAPREMSSSYFCSSLQYNVPSLVLGAIQKDTSRIVNISIFDLINNENRLTRYQTEEVVPKLRVTRQLIEEIYNAPDPPPRPKPCPIKPMRLFQPVQYGTKPEGRLAAMTTAAGQRPPTSSPLTGTSASATSQSAQSRGKSPVTTATSIASAQGRTISASAVLRRGQEILSSHSQNRISQPETPVTLQFQGNKFTLSPSQLRQLTTGQPLQLQGTLHIVSTPGQPIIRPHAIQPVTQALPASNASSTPATLHPALSTTQQGLVTLFTVCTTSHCNVQESSEEKTQQQKERLSRLFEANERRCNRRVLYGSDLLQACTLMSEPDHSVLTAGGWRWMGRESCLRAQRTCVATTSALQLSPLSVADRLEAGNNLIKRLLCVVPPAVAPPPHLYAANTPITYSVEQKSFRRQLHEASAPHIADIHDLACRHLFHYPDLQLMQMDSGKLEALAILLQKLRSENRRVLIFTQMVKMLDILEAFLDYRQLTYVRSDHMLDIVSLQENMKKFNRNRQVFCCILTNRCCSAVGTVFDADTIIFYDTDLNPSMDARTQEWCDRIGRSKDIHIYRLESGNSIEEKLLKNGTKDLIREVAAQGTDYTLAFLTQRTIQDLFEVEAGSGEKVEEFVVLHQEPSASEAISPRVARPYIQALHSINLDALPEEEEQQQEEEELADKETTNENQESETQAEEEPAQIEELNAVMEQLTPIERYALHYLEYLHVRDDETALKLECSKRGWELQQLQKLKEEEQERQIMEGDEDLFTYTREDAYNMEYIFEAEDGHTEIMPLWTPPTPPQDDNDIYIDSVMMLMYDTTPMPESKLPPVYIRKEHKRLKMDPSAAARKKKKGHGETVIPPRSLFEKASMLKVRREGKDQKKNFSLKQQAPFAKPLPSLAKPAMEAGQDNPEWLISEDWALLQAVKQLLELPLNLTIVSPAHTPNWDLVSDVVNSCSRIYRSPKQCRNRYENVIIPREEGKLVYEANPKKKTKSIYKNSRPLRTCQIYTQDDNATHMQLYNSRFELMKIIASKRSPPIKPLLGMNPFQKNPKHASVLAESGISYDKPLPPIQVASQRAERIAKEKKVTALAEQQKAQQLAQQQQAGAPQAQTAPGQAQAPAAGQTQAQVPQAAAVAGAAAVSNAAVLVRITTPFVSMYSEVFSLCCCFLLLVQPAGAQVVHTQQRAVAGPAPSEVVTIATGPGVRAVTPVTAPAVVSPILSPAQSQPRQMGAQASAGTGLKRHL
uniref:E1A binding protein p400 n=1 Tax=Mastacembelus armatus TaxID=205130 RepID=A0A7N8XZZ7_9TELE